MHVRSYAFSHRRTSPWTADAYRRRRIPSAKALVRSGVVGAGGVGPPSSSVSANGREALCGWPFPQVAANRRCRSYAFSWRLVLSPSRTHGIRDCVRGSVDAGARLGTGPRLGRGPVRGRAGLQRRGSRRPARCLGDNCPYSVVYGPVGSSQVRLGDDSGESGLDRCSCGLWNDRQNDHQCKLRRGPRGWTAST